MERIRSAKHALDKGMEREAAEGETEMRITYDAEIDALYIRLIEGEDECRTLRLNDEIALNIAPAEALVGIEVLDARQVLGQGQLPSLVVEGLAVA